MSYASGGVIEAVDFNTFRSQLQQVYGVGFGDTGYGQTSINVPIVSGGFVENIKSAEWIDLRNAISICQQHQGLSGDLIPPVTSLQVGDLITAHDGITDPDNFPQTLTDISTSRLATSNTAMSTFLSRNTQTVANSWTNTAFTVIDIDFPTADDARYFFNSGGEVIIRCSFVPNGLTNQNISWQSLLSGSGSISLGYNNTTSTGFLGTPSSQGYYTLPASNSLTTIFAASPPSSGSSGGSYYYSGYNNYNINAFEVSARTLNTSGTNGDNGRTIRLRIDFDDNYAGGDDAISGILAVEIDEKRATTYLTIPSFSVNVQTPLNAT